MKNLWEEVKEKCLDNASKCMEDGAFEEAERLLKMALEIHNAIETEIDLTTDCGSDCIGETVKLQEDQMNELQELARPVVEFLRKNYHPYAIVTISYDRIKLDETTLWIPQNDYAG